MFYLKRVIMVIVILLVVSVWFMASMVEAEDGATSAHLTAEQAVYSGRGPHAVGLRSLVIDDELPITVWYPTVAAAHGAAAMRYPYEVKLFGALPALRLASFAGEALVDAPFAQSAELYPLVILSPGFAMGGQTYGWLAEHLASYGFVVLAPEHNEQLDPGLLWRSTITRPRDMQTVLAFIEAQSQADGLFAGVVDGQRIAVVGHSYGGYTAQTAGGGRLDTAALAASCHTAYETDDPLVFLCDALLPRMADMVELAGLEDEPEGLWPNWSDERVRAVVSLAGDAAMFGQAGLAQINVPVMAIGGTADKDSPYPWSVQATYEYASSAKKVQVGLVGAEHMIFTGRCETARRVMTFAPTLFCTDPAWEKPLAHDLVNHFTAAFLLAELQGDGEAAAVFDPAVVRFDGVIYEAEGY